MKAFSRKASLIIVAVFALTLLLAACGNNDNDSGTTNQPTNQPTDVPTPPAPPADVDPTDVDEYYGVESDPPVRAAGIHEPRDLGGQVLRIGSWWEGTLAFAWDGEEPDPAEAQNYFIDRLIWDNSQRVLQEFNFTLEEVILEY
ncbi:MAG: hypothetical protein FWG38_11790, partial [Defluviitaleaceae bacterium]|nr:hypothetical protein [Defluviitaleaceae bacterium]